MARASGLQSFQGRQAARLASRVVEFIDVYVNRRPIGHAYMQDDQLEGALTLRGNRRTRLDGCAR